MEKNFYDIYKSFLDYDFDELINKGWQPYSETDVNLLNRNTEELKGNIGHFNSLSWEEYVIKKIFVEHNVNIDKNFHIDSIWSYSLSDKKIFYLIRYSYVPYSTIKKNLNLLYLLNDCSPIPDFIMHITNASDIESIIRLSNDFDPKYLIDDVNGFRGWKKIFENNYKGNGHFFENEYSIEFHKTFVYSLLRDKIMKFLFKDKDPKNCYINSIHIKIENNIMFLYIGIRHQNVNDEINILYVQFLSDKTEKFFIIKGSNVEINDLVVLMKLLTSRYKINNIPYDIRKKYEDIYQ